MKIAYSNLFGNLEEIDHLEYADEATRMTIKLLRKTHGIKSGTYSLESSVPLLTICRFL